MAQTPDYYKILGVSKTATQDEIKKAFRRLARKHHPDAGGDEARFKEINEAYEVLSDEEKRKIYDQFGSADPHQIPYNWQGGNPFGGGVEVDFSNIGGFADIIDMLKNGGGAGYSAGGGFGDIFDSIRNGSGVGGQAYQQQPGNDRVAHLHISFDEAFHGCEKQIRITKPNSSEKETLKIKVPAGAVEGDRLKFKGKGAPGINGGPAGDLKVVINIDPHPYFRRDGADVHIDIPVRIDEALLGSKVVVPMPDGSKLKMKIPAGTKPETILTVSGKGAPRVKGSGFGSLKAHIIYDIPTKFSPEQEKALKVFSKASANINPRHW